MLIYSLLAGFYLSPCGKCRTTSSPMRTESVAGGLLLVGGHHCCWDLCEQEGLVFFYTRYW